QREIASMNKLSLKMKLRVGFGALLVIIAAMSVITYLSVGKLSSLGDEVDKQWVKEGYLTSMDNGLEMQTSGTRGFLISASEATLKRREEGKAQFMEMANKYRPLIQTDAGHKLLARIEELGAEVDAAQTKAIELRRAGKSIEEASAPVFNPQTNQV